LRRESVDEFIYPKGEVNGSDKFDAEPWIIGVPEVGLAEDCTVSAKTNKQPPFSRYRSNFGPMRFPEMEEGTTKKEKSC